VQIARHCFASFAAETSCAETRATTLHDRSQGIATGKAGIRTVTLVLVREPPLGPGLQAFKLRSYPGTALLKKWSAWACRSQIPAFVEPAKSGRACRPAIEAALTHGLTNARVESANTKVRSSRPGPRRLPAVGRLARKEYRMLASAPPCQNRPTEGAEDPDITRCSGEPWRYLAADVQEAVLATVVSEHGTARIIDAARQAGPVYSATLCDMRTVTHREMRNESGEILRRVANGETIQVTNHGQVAALIVPPGTDTLTELVSRGQVRLAVRPLSSLRLVARRRAGADSKAIIDEIRGRW